MYRIIGGDGREYGPVTGDSIRQWVLQNRANAKTLVRADDSADWRPLGEIPEFAGSFGAPPPQQAETPPPVPPAAPATPTTPADPAALTAEYANRETGFSIGDCIGGAFRLLGVNYWQAVGVTFLVMLCFFVSQFIPIVGFFSSLLLTQAFYAGLYYYFLKMSRGEVTVVGDGFSGFSIAFGQLVLLSLVMTLLIAVVALPTALPIVGIFLWQWDPWIMWPLAFMLALPAIYLNVSWVLAPILVVDRGLEFWDAMELSRKVVTKHWFGMFFTVLLAAIIAGAGVLAIGIGLIFTMPVMFATIAVAYLLLFPRE